MSNVKCRSVAKAMERRRQISNVSRSGQLLLEILVAISAAALVVGLGAQLIFVSLQANKGAAEKNVALGLLEETLEAARDATGEQWQNLYNLVKNDSHHPEKSGGKWVIATGTENVAIDSITYTRSFVVQNVCRDNSNRNITGITDSNGSSTTACTVSDGSPDTSTQKVTVTVSWPNAPSLLAGEYVTRWRNKVCSQTSWASQSSATSTCPVTTYGSSTNITTGTSLQLCSGGC